MRLGSPLAGPYTVSLYSGRPCGPSSSAIVSADSVTSGRFESRYVLLLLVNCASGFSVASEEADDAVDDVDAVVLDADEPNTEAGAAAPNTEDAPKDGAVDPDPNAGDLLAPKADGLPVEFKVEAVDIAPNAEIVGAPAPNADGAPNVEGVDVDPDAEGVDVDPNPEGVEVVPNADAGCEEPKADGAVLEPNAEGAVCEPNAEGLDCAPNAVAGLPVEPNVEPRLLPKAPLEPVPKAEAVPARGDAPKDEGEPKALCCAGFTAPKAEAPPVDPKTEPEDPPNAEGRELDALPKAVGAPNAEPDVDEDPNADGCPNPDPPRGPPP